MKIFSKLNLSTPYKGPITIPIEPIAIPMK